MSIFTWLPTILYSILDAFRFAIWTTSSSSIEYLELSAARSKTYEEWLACQTELDVIIQKDEWFDTDQDHNYDWKALLDHKIDLEQCRINGDNRGLASQLRSHSSRNMCRSLSPPLYRVSRVRTKDLIHNYQLEVSGAIRHLAMRDSMIASPNVISSQDKRQLFSDVRQALGRTTLVLQGGTAFSTCHLGVVKALLKQNLLPHIITGTAMGALIGALVCTTPTDELEERLTGKSINLSAFERARSQRKESQKGARGISTWYATVSRRISRYYTSGHLFDIDVLHRCAEDNLGNITFGEAYLKTGRILNITVALSDVPGMPQLLNYITAPHVFIWSAAVASIATSKRMYGPVSLVCKDGRGHPARFLASDSVSQSHRWGQVTRLEPPLKRVGELFNVNHFIVSQTRPYIIPFIRWQQPRSGVLGIWISTLITLACNEGLHWLHRLSRNGWMAPFISRLLLDETIPGGSHWSKIAITPNLHLQDYFHIFDIPNSVSIDEWSLRGERSVWPAICELKIRCDVEFELDAAHESVRRRMPGQVYV